MNSEFDSEALRKRLDAIILLLMEISAGGAESTTRKIERLLKLGLSSTEVAQVIGKELNYVTAVVSGKKRTAKKKRSTES